MQRNLSSLLIAVLAFAVVSGWNQLTQAALCSQCRDLIFTDSEGKCADCGAPTASGALQLCPKCSAKKHQCEHCRAATTEKDEAAAESKPSDVSADKPHSNEAHETDSHKDDGQSRDSHDKPPPAWTAPTNSDSPTKLEDTPAAKPRDSELNLSSPPVAETEKPTPKENLPETNPPAELPSDLAAPMSPKPINASKPGTYTSGKWRYQLQITSPGTTGEGRWGWLTYNGQKLPRGNPNDFYNTPWGPIYWVDVPTTTWGTHGWMPAPLPQSRRVGQALTLPSAPLSAAPTQPGNTSSGAVAPPVPPATAVPAKPSLQKLEINKSHNGQLARLRVGNILVVRLPGNPATGYQWQIGTTNSPAVRLTVRPQYSPPASTATDAALSGTYTFIFQAVQPGTGSIRLYYVRPTDPSRPRDSFAVGVNVSPAATPRSPAFAPSSASQKSQFSASGTTDR